MPNFAIPFTQLGARRETFLLAPNFDQHLATAHMPLGSTSLFASSEEAETALESRLQSRYGAMYQDHLDAYPSGHAKWRRQLAEWKSRSLHAVQLGVQPEPAPERPEQPLTLQAWLSANDEGYQPLRIRLLGDGVIPFAGGRTWWLRPHMLPVNRPFSLSRTPGVLLGIDTVDFFASEEEATAEAAMRNRVEHEHAFLEEVAEQHAWNLEHEQNLERWRRDARLSIEAGHTPPAPPTKPQPVDDYPTWLAQQQTIWVPQMFWSDGIETTK